MSMQTALVGFEVTDELVGGTPQDEVEAWLRALVPVKTIRTVREDGTPTEIQRPLENRFFLDGYLALRANGWAWREALCIVWMSLGRDDRGSLATVGDLCDFLGVSRMWFYEHKARYADEPAPGLNAWDWWAERLQLARLRGSRLAEVDEATFRRAVSAEGKAADRELYYKRAGVLVQRTEVAATVGQVVDVSELDEAALDALLAREGKMLPSLEDEGGAVDEENQKGKEQEDEST